MDIISIVLAHRLTDQQQQYVLARQSSLKQSSTAYICWFVVGVHYFYLNKPFINLFYWITGAGFGIWAFIDLFRIPGMVKEYNEKKILEFIQEAKRLYPN